MMHVDGVLVFYAREAKEEDGRLTQVVSTIATQLGFALQHKRLEEELLKQQALVGRNHENLEKQVEQRVRQQEAVVDLGRQALGGADLSTAHALGYGVSRQDFERRVLQSAGASARQRCFDFASGSRMESQGLLGRQP